MPDKNWEIAGLRFHVKIDPYDLGYWSKVDGLSVKFEIAEYRSGDTKNRRWIEPCHTTWGTVKLSRATTLEYTQKVLRWLQATSFKSDDAWTGVITAYPLWYDEYGAESEQHKLEFPLMGILPVAWSGPQFDAGAGRLAMETLEIAHEGFLDPDH